MMRTGQRDVVVITVDSWRADAVERMPNCRGLTEQGYDRATAVPGAAATHGAFPPLLASDHAVACYESGGSVRPSVTTLPERLSEAGYRTAGFIASNPFCSKWADRFDHFWNDGMQAADAGDEWGYATLDRARRFLALRKRVPAPRLVERARDWYETTAPPRFLWLHLMDTHGPYFPGLRRARRVGLARTYRTLYRYHVADQPYDRVADGLRALYRQCVDRLDSYLPEVVEFLAEDAVVALTADHGEEFDHGYHGHGQLYDECVRVPLFTRGLDADLAETTVRHLDLPPTLTDAVDVSSPDGWRGSPVGRTASNESDEHADSGSVTNGTSASDEQVATLADRPALMANHSPRLGQTFIGVRTDRHKYVRTYDDESWTIEREELYDLLHDPDEQELVDDPGRRDRLANRVDTFIARPDTDLDVIRETTPGVESDVRDRLRELGYVADSPGG